MDRWEEYRAGKLDLPAIVQVDNSGVLVATKSGFLGPFSEVKNAKAEDYVKLAPVVVEPEPVEDYKVKYDSLKASVDAIDIKLTKEAIVASLSKLQTVKAVK